MTADQTKEAQFKQRFVSVLEDLRRDGVADGEAMAMIGTLAADIARPLGQSTWSGAKASLTAQGYDELLNSFRKQGNALHQAGKTKQAYAVQALSVSLVARTQRADKDLAAGEKLLDALIDRSVAQVLSIVARRTN
jgi:hypothetical protein